VRTRSGSLGASSLELRLCSVSACWTPAAEHVDSTEAQQQGGGMASRPGWLLAAHRKVAH
jgi:hypothetical protein